MISETRLGIPVECHETTILPIIRRFCERTGTGMVGSVTPVALFIVREPDVWFIALEEGCSPDDLMAGIMSSEK